MASHSVEFYFFNTGNIEILGWKYPFYLFRFSFSFLLCFVIGSVKNELLKFLVLNTILRLLVCLKVDCLSGFFMHNWFDSYF